MILNMWYSLWLCLCSEFRREIFYRFVLSIHWSSSIVDLWCPTCSVTLVASAGIVPGPMLPPLLYTHNARINARNSWDPTSCPLVHSLIHPGVCVAKSERLFSKKLLAECLVVLGLCFNIRQAWPSILRKAFCLKLSVLVTPTPALTRWLIISEPYMILYILMQISSNSKFVSCGPLCIKKSILFKLWCRQAASHYLNQCWPKSMSAYINVAGPQLHG